MIPNLSGYLQLLGDDTVCLFVCQRRVRLPMILAAYLYRQFAPLFRFHLYVVLQKDGQHVTTIELATVHDYASTVYHLKELQQLRFGDSFDVLCLHNISVKQIVLRHDLIPVAAVTLSHLLRFGKPGGDKAADVLLVVGFCHRLYQLL